MKDWVSEIQDRMKNGDNACAVLELCHHELLRGIEDDVKYIEYSDHVPEDLKFRQELLAELEDAVRVCNEYGEYCEMKFEQKMEKSISRLERIK